MGQTTHSDIPVSADWKDGGRLDLLVDAIKLQTDKIAGKMLFHLEPLATPIVEEIPVTNAAVNQTIGSITIANILAGATVVAAYVDFEFRVVENTSSAGINKLNGAQYIQIQKAAGAFTNAITLPDDLFTLAASTREGGMLIKGNTDLAATVTANDTYTIQWTNAIADRANLNFNEVQAYLRLVYSI